MAGKIGKDELHPSFFELLKNIDGQLVVDISKFSKDQFNAVLRLIGNSDGETLIRFIDNNGNDRGYIGLQDDYMKIAAGNLRIQGGNDKQQTVEVEASKGKLPTYVIFRNNTDKSKISGMIHIIPGADDSKDFQSHIHLQFLNTTVHGELVPFEDNKNTLGKPNYNFLEAFVQRVRLGNSNTTITDGGITQKSGYMGQYDISVDGAVVSLQKNVATNYLPTFRPNGNGIELGHSAHPWKNVYSVSGTITPSDKRLKRNISYIDETIMKSGDKDYIEKCYDFIKNLRFAKYEVGVPIYVAKEQENGSVKYELSDVDFSNSKTTTGFIAQDIQGTEVGDDILITSESTDTFTYSDREFNNSIAMALQKVIKDNEILKKELEDAKSRIQQLEAR